MRPTTDELLNGMRHVLEDVLLPELDSPWAMAMGTQMQLLFHHLTGRAAYEPVLLAAENRWLASLLDRAYEHLGEANHAADTEGADGNDTDLDVLRQRNAELRAALSAGIERAYEHGEYRPDELPTERMGIGADLIQILLADVDFWKPTAVVARQDVPVDLRRELAREGN